MQVPDLIRAFVERLERLGVPYMVTGSTAGILYGEPRMTHDVDIVIALRLKDVDAFVAAFPIDDSTAHRTTCSRSRFGAASVGTAT